MIGQGTYIIMIGQGACIKPFNQPMLVTVQSLYNAIMGESFQNSGF